MTKQQLITENMKLVYHVLNEYFPRHINDEDVVQAGMLGLCKAADTWKEGKTKFSTYACKCIRNTIYKEFTYRNRHKNQLSLEYEYDSQYDDEVITLADMIAGEEDCDFDYSEDFYKTLSPHQIEIIEMRKNGVSISEIGRHFGVNRQAIWNSLRFIKRKWNKYNG